MSVKKYIIYFLLFLATIATTTIAGAEWIYGKFIFMGEHALQWHEITDGLYFSLPLLAILTVHEFGHYFTAKYHRVKVTLPFYIPLWLGFIQGLFSIGTMGAFIRIKEKIKSKKKYFDIGIAGPLTGFIAALLVLYYGYTHLPPTDYIYKIHPEYEAYGQDYAKHVYDKDDIIAIKIGSNLVINFFEKYIATQPERIPNAYEFFHYPWLFAGFIALFFTAINLLPIGQLDGGHILYGLIGYKNHKIVSPILYVAFVFYAGLGLVSPFLSMQDLMLHVPIYTGFLYLLFAKVRSKPIDRLLLAVAVMASQFIIVYIFPTIKGYTGWLFFAFVLGRVLGIYHPPSLEEKPLDTKRVILGCIALAVFVVCFSPQPFVIE